MNSCKAELGVGCLSAPCDGCNRIILLVRRRLFSVPIVCGPRRWPVARRPFDSWELLESDS